MDLDSAMGGGKFCFSFLQNVNWNSALTACHAGHPGPEQSSQGHQDKAVHGMSYFPPHGPLRPGSEAQS